MKAREGYKQRFPKLAKACDGWSDRVFLDKAGLTIEGKITHTTLLLVGKETSAHKLNHIAQLVWKCFQKVEYSKHKGLADKKCEALLLDSLNDHNSLTKQEIVRLL